MITMSKISAHVLRIVCCSLPSKREVSDDDCRSVDTEAESTEHDFHVALANRLYKHACDLREDYDAASFDEILEAYKISLRIKADIYEEHSTPVARTLYSIGTLYHDYGNYQRALLLYTHVESLVDDLNVNTVITDLATFKRYKGDAQCQLGLQNDAIDSYQESYKVFSARGDPQCLDCLEKIEALQVENMMTVTGKDSFEEIAYETELRKLKESLEQDQQKIELLEANLNLESFLLYGKIKYQSQFL